MGKVYYNEIDPYCAQWLRNLIDKKLLPPGNVDHRDIKDVKADELRGYRQLHFFAGIGGWPLALQIADWPDDRPVWTGSCPCQPFSAAGKKKAQADSRHLWPAWFDLIKQLRPAKLFGEQVAGSLAIDWITDVSYDLETQGYAVGMAVLPACSVGAPHRRDRLFFMANSARDESRRLQQSGISPNAGASSKALPYPDGERVEAREEFKIRQRQRPSNRPHSSRAAASHWQTDAGIRRLADGIPNRVAKLRALGNAIVPQLAAEFIKASIGAINE